MTFFDKLRRKLRLIATPPPPTEFAAAPEPVERWDEQVRASGQTIDQWVAGRRERGRLYADQSDAAIDRIRTRWPERAKATRAAADAVCGHVFDLLGSGPVEIVDPDRPVTSDGYRSIDWAVDPIAGLRFPSGFPHKQWTADMRPGLADIKWPWEIGRCQHWVTLGQAFRLTRDERFAVEIVRQHADFMTANPVGIGVQFVCTMDVAIRAMNWAIAFELIRLSKAFDATAMAHAYQSLFDVGVFIEGNLENKYEVTSNHFLSNVVGLHAVGLAFADLAAGRRWSNQCRQWLEQEMKVQVLPDGADYESSVPYHRLVTELFLGGARMAQLEGAPLSAEYLARLRQMVQFHFDVLRPDGLMPQIGDADDGRLHIFTNYGTWKPQDGRHLGGAAAAVFDDASWLAMGGDDAAWEAAWWSDREVPALPGAPSSPDVAVLFRDAGLAVCRRGDNYLLVSNGRVGTNGFGNHKHNDLLSFEYHANGMPLIVDAGSYVYTSDPRARNQFRSTAFHNTLAIDGIEQNDVRLDYLFRMFETSTVAHVDLQDGEDTFEYTGRHTGYARLPEPVMHERHFTLAKSTGALTISDRLTGEGRHTLSWHFHVAPGVVVAPAADAFLLTSGRQVWRLRIPAGITGTVSDSWYSPSYGVRVPCAAIDLTMQTVIAGGQLFAFAIETHRG